MTNPIPPSLDHFGEELDRAADRELSRSSVRSSGALRAVIQRPRRLLAGGSLGLAGLSAGLVLALSGTAATAPAFAVTRQDDGSVLVTINQMESVPQANAKLTSMGAGEAVTIHFVQGAVTTSGPVTCAVGAGVSGPPLKVLLDADGTDVIAAGNTGAGTWHVASCTSTAPGTGAAGNSGAPATVATVLSPASTH